MKKLFIFLLLSIIGVSLYSCSTTCKCSVPAKDALGNPTVIKYPDK